MALPIGLAKKQQARCCMEAFVLYATFQYFLNAILTHWGSTFGVDFSAAVGGSSGLTTIAGIKTLDMGMIGALLISGIVVFIHNKFFDVKLPDWLGIFNGAAFIVIIGFFILLPVALVAAFIWPTIQHGMVIFQNFIAGTGYVGVWVFVFLERLLIPFGLHHLLAFPFYYDSAVIAGGVKAAWIAMLPELAASTEPLKDLAPFAWPQLLGLSKVFGCTGIALALYKTAKPEKKTKVAGLLIPITLTAVLAGITEPIEFTFLFIAPLLFVVHAILAATLATVANMFGVVGYLSGGLIETAATNFIPLMKNHWPTYLTLLIIGLIFVAIYYFVFTFLILKFDFKTPGREDDDDIVFKTKAEYREKQSNGKAAIITDSDMALQFLEGLGGKDNITDVTNCVTRLRVNVKDGALVQSDAYFRAAGAHGLVHKDKSIQVIVGLNVTAVRDEFEQLL
ncbi:alpha-glucoside-specific PTS transporter subunit IIBC [Candidatus Epulonipiscium viviparus]|uniref:alpha-glucoside-specific PTS transporter subunit IIBC n=1 Tax=Candidatus Epulonipiscium viviparus TaxID=420336 RepID=UPI0027380FCA|nr:alpha-glucoside-specific PTS transporter subunit IIBC [Candidatus Epulopiscium viviparus]